MSRDEVLFDHEEVGTELTRILRNGIYNTPINVSKSNEISPIPFDSRSFRTLQQMAYRIDINHIKPFARREMSMNLIHSWLIDPVSTFRWIRSMKLVRMMPFMTNQVMDSLTEEMLHIQLEYPNGVIQTLTTSQKQGDKDTYSKMLDVWRRPLRYAREQGVLPAQLRDASDAEILYFILQMELPSNQT